MAGAEGQLCSEMNGWIKNECIVQETQYVACAAGAH
jgi:hypothetical protein